MARDKEIKSKSFNAFTRINNKLTPVKVSVQKKKKNNIFDRNTLSRLRELKKIYQKVPNTKCRMCGQCCWMYVISPVYTIEYLNILQYVSKHFHPGEIKKLNSLSRVNLITTRHQREEIIKKRNFPDRSRRWFLCGLINEFRDISSP